MSHVAFEAIAPSYTKWWAEMSIKPDREHEFDVVTNRLAGNKSRYEAVEAATGVPWYMVAVIHEREAGGDFRGCLANGDPWNQVTRNVPQGRGPWASWHDAAVWALKYEGLAGQPKEFWTVEQMLYHCELYNGFGYWNYHGRMPSPYVWGGTTVQVRGKYVADGKWSSNAWDSQLGCAGMLKILMERHEGIAPAPPVSSPKPAPAPSVPVAGPAPKTFWQIVLDRFLGR